MVTSVTSGANAAASITLVGSPSQRHKIQQITWSYAAAPTGGRISTTGLEGDELDFDVTAGGPGGLALPPSAYGTVNGTVVVTIAAGSGAIVGKLSVFHELE